MLAGHKEKIILCKSGAAVVWVWDREVVTPPSLGAFQTQRDRALSYLL